MRQAFFFNMADNHCNFGEHLTIDGYRGSLEKLNDKALVLKCLNELAELLKMKKLIEPQICLAPDNHKNDPDGWSGFVIIAESHISLHTFPRRGFISADVYTCKTGLDKKFIADYFIKKFNLKDMETHFLMRGTEYPVKDIY